MLGPSLLSLERKSTPPMPFASHRLTDDGSSNPETPSSLSRASSSPALSKTTSLLGSSLGSAITLEQPASVMQKHLDTRREILDINLDKMPMPDFSNWQEGLFALTLRSRNPQTIALPASLATCKHLQQLHLINVNVVNLASLAENLKNVRQLSLYHPDVTEAPAGIDQFPELKQLSLNGCKEISRLPTLNAQQLEQLTIDIQGTALAKEHTPLVWFLLSPCYKSVFSDHAFSQSNFADAKVSEQARLMEPLLNYLPDFQPPHAKPSATRAAFIEQKLGLRLPVAG